MQFKPGSVVQLKSGGPKMTVASVDARDLNVLEALGAPTAGIVERVNCIWFIHDEVKHGTFIAKALTEVV